MVKKASKQKKSQKPKSKPSGAAKVFKKIAKAVVRSAASLKQSKASTVKKPVLAAKKGAPIKKGAPSAPSKETPAKLVASKSLLKSATKPVAAKVAEKSVGKTLKGIADPKGTKCTHTGCKQPGMIDGYCRLHYMMAYQATKLQGRKEAQGRLKGMIQDLSENYPDEYMDLLKSDLSSDATFRQAVHEMELDQDQDIELESVNKRSTNDHD